MLSTGWSIYVAILSAINIFAVGWLLWWVNSGYDPSESKGENGTMGHVWDGDLEEYNNPMPRWWMGMFVISIIFSVIYLVLYPGMGNWKGVLNWSQQDEHAQAWEKHQAEFSEKLSVYSQIPDSELKNNEPAMAIAQSVFANRCVACHGSNAEGAPGYPNLRDDEWLYGGSIAQIEESITLGRKGSMPAWGALLGEKGSRQVAVYVKNLSEKQLATEEYIAEGETKFKQTCVACHGDDAKGKIEFGAPDLTNFSWLHSGHLDDIEAIIRDGKNSNMPAHEGVLPKDLIRLVAAYVQSLSEQK